MSTTSCIAKDPRVTSPGLPQDGPYGAVWFDLDGTLVDTAPDMVAVLQAMQRAHGVLPVRYDVGRSHVSNGAIGLLRLGFPGRNVEFGDPLHRDYLDRYAAAVCRDSRLFDGLDQVLDQLDTAGCPWGVITNKPENLTKPLLDSLGLAHRSACTVSGDSLPVRKPDPAPLLHACELAGVEASRSIYVGDALRDIEAGRRAGMATIAAAYGYIVAGDDPVAWGADVIASNTAELSQIILKAVNLEP